jgi:septum site-determining protein MinD
MLAVAGGKGGCGKTTTALGVAAALADCAAPESVVVADADRDMPDLHALAGVDRTPTLAGAARAPPAESPGAPADRLPDPAPRVLPAPQGLGTDAATALARLSETVDVVDCPAGSGPDAAEPLRVADRALLVARRTRESLGDALKTATMARELDCRPVGVVLTRTDAIPDAVTDELDVPAAWTVPDGGGRPLTDPAVRAAYRQIAGSASA